MKTILSKNNKLISIFLIFYWIILLTSINSNFSEVHLLNQNYIQRVNAFKIYLSLFISLIIFFYFFFIFLVDKIKLKRIEIFFLLLFVSQIIGLYLNKERDFDLNNLYISILGIGLIFLLALCSHKRLYNVIKYFIYILIFFFIFAFAFVFIGKIEYLNILELYNSFSKYDNNLLNQVNPRITGISRILAIINLFLFLFFFKSRNFYFNISIIFFLIVFTIILLLMESRGTLLSYYTSIIIVIFFFLKKKLTVKLKYFFILIIVPILLFFFIKYLHYNKNYLIDKNQKINTRILTATTSGRSEIWSYTIKNYNYKKIFGYGVNGDRFFLKKFDKKESYGDNVSNIWLYSLISGGFISIFFLLLIFFEIFKILKINNNISNKNIFYYNLSISFLVFFLIRSFYENSFGLFSTDFIVTYLSIIIITYLNQKFRMK